MPTLKKIVVQDFRNIAFQELSFSPNVNCISGNNGEGKTNLAFRHGRIHHRRYLPHGQRA